ncbi:MAG: heparan-alpha-glucosaminide N-acetyltransferase [Clostridia bacterium]|nr:heparan-alpha-glucosaminide N-acetyltransferase [Clostridia bacterium]MDD4047874.1 heparan-alpha-glucosaminide N-acetyltransferase [Clostridia bacterium]
MKNRIWGLDFLRGIALVLMVYFHIMYDMKEMYNYEVIYESGFNYYIGKASGILFILVSGISCSFSRNNTQRAIKLFFIAMGITILTHIYESDLGIKFGILHFLSLSILMSKIFLKINSYLLAVFGTIIIFLSRYVYLFNVNWNLFFPLGITTANFISSDYYPLIPWFGVFIYGLILGKKIYCKKTRRFSHIAKAGVIITLGKYTLPIYLIHQPVIMMILKIIRSVDD